MTGRLAPRIVLRHVVRQYGPAGGGAIRALDGVDLELVPGESVSIEGPSGCGKTTLLNLLGLLDVPTSGEILWDGTSIGARPERERAQIRLTRVGFIFQRFYLLPTLTSEENVEVPMRALGVPGPERRARAEELLDRVGLSGRRRSYPHELSGGEEQRVAIARAIANRPGLLLADEPTGELDSANARRVLELLLDTARSEGATLVLVTHNPAVASGASRHLRLSDGRIVSDGRGT